MEQDVFDIETAAYDMAVDAASEEVKQNKKADMCIHINSFADFVQFKLCNSIKRFYTCFLRCQLIETANLVLQISLANQMISFDTIDAIGM